MLVRPQIPSLFKCAVPKVWLLKGSRIVKMSQSLMAGFPEQTMFTKSIPQSNLISIYEKKYQRKYNISIAQSYWKALTPFLNCSTWPGDELHTTKWTGFSASTKFNASPGRGVNIQQMMVKTHKRKKPQRVASKLHPLNSHHNPKIWLHDIIIYIMSQLSHENNPSYFPLHWMVYCNPHKYSPVYT